jgi:hypothetical protein
MSRLRVRHEGVFRFDGFYRGVDSLCGWLVAVFLPVGYIATQLVKAY